MREYAREETRAETADETRSWIVILPASFDSFTFNELPDGAARPLAPGYNWTLRVTAARIEHGVLVGLPDVYRRIQQNWVGIGPSERGVNAYSSTEINISTN